MRRGGRARSSCRSFWPNQTSIKREALYETRRYASHLSWTLAPANASRALQPQTVAVPARGSHAPFPAHRAQGKAKVVSSGAPADAVAVADVAKGRTAEMNAAMAGASALIIASSAVPQVPYAAPDAARVLTKVSMPVLSMQNVS